MSNVNTSSMSTSKLKECLSFKRHRQTLKSFMYSGAAIWNSLSLHVNTSVNTFKSLYMKWKRLNGHWVISITTDNLILYVVSNTCNTSCLFCDLYDLVLMPLYVLAYYCFLWVTTTLVPFIYTWSLLPTQFYW